MNATIMKGERSKLLALVAIMAMVVCAFAVALPATDAADGEADYSVSDTAGLLNALDAATDGQVIELDTGEYGKVDVTAAEGQSDNNKIYFDSTNGYTSFLIDTPNVTIRAAADAEPVIYGALVITASGVTVQDLTINITYMANYERNAITVAASSATITGNTINMSETSSNLCNGVMLYPATDGTYTISGNTFNDFTKDADWNSNAILVYENYALTNVSADRIGDAAQSYTSCELSMGVTEELRMVAANTYVDCEWNYSTNDNSTGTSVRETRAVGTYQGEIADGDVFEISANAETGYTYTLVKQSSDKLDLDLAQNENLVISETAIYDGRISGEGADNVINNGLWANPSGTDADVIEVGSSEALLSLNSISTYKTIKLVADAELTSGWWIGSGVTLDLNGYDLESTSIIGVNEGSYLKVPAGSELTISQIRFSTEAAPAYDWLVTSPAIPETETSDAISASMIVFTKELSQTFINSNRGSLSTYIPNITTGTDIKVLGSNFVYSVRHFTAPSGDDIQYGVGINDLTYRGTAYKNGEFVFDYKSFDTEYTIINSSANFVNTDNIKEVGIYHDAIELQMNFDKDITDSIPPVLVTTELDVTVNPADSTAIFDNNEDADVSVESSGVQVSVSGDVSEDEQGYYVTLGIDMRIFDENGTLVPVTSGYSLTLGGDDLAVVDGTVRIPVDKLTGTTSVQVVYDADGNGKNYQPTTYTISFGQLKASADVEFVPMGSEETVYGQKVSDLQTDLKITEDAENPGTYYITGAVDWIDNYDGYSAGSYGYFIAFDIVLPQGITWDKVTISVQHGDFSQTWTGTYDGFFVGKVTDSSDVVIKVDLDGSGSVFGEDTYTLKLVGTEENPGLTYNPYSYYEEDVDGDADTNDDTILAGVSLKDVTDETMYMIFDSLGLTEAPVITLYYGDVIGEDGSIIEGSEVAYTETMTVSDADAYIWYASFLNQLKDVEKGGVYTIQAVIDGQTVAVDTVNVPVVYGFGYDESAEQVVSDISEATGGEIVLSTEGTNGVAPETMWIAWYTAAQTEGAIATLEWNGHVIYTETVSAWNEVNPHVWYFSFDKDNYSFIGEKDTAVNESGYWDNYEKIRPGVYLMTVTDGEGKELASGEVVIDGYTEAYYEDLAADALKGMKFDGIDTSKFIEGQPSGVAPETMWIVWYNSAEITGFQATLEWNGQVIFTETDNAATFTPGAHLWYFSFDDLNDSFIGKNNENWPWTDQEYTGIVGGEYKLTVKDAAGNLVAEGTYTHYDPDTYYVSFDEQGTEYDLVDMPMAYGDRIQMPDSAINGMTIKYWNMVVDGEVRTYNPGSMFVVGVSSPAKIISFVAEYENEQGGSGVSEHSIQYWIGAAPEYVYSAGYTYNGWYDIDGTTVYAVYSADEYTAGTPMMYDFARYLGALYYASEGDIVSIYVDGKLYTWDADGPQIGSNWYNADGETLVSVIADLFQSADGYAKNGITMELTNQAGDRVAMNYYLAIESDGTGSGDDGYKLVRQLSDYYFDYTVEGNTVTITVKTDLIDGYRNVLDTIRVSWGMMFATGGNNVELYIDEPDENGVVCQYSFTVTDENIDNVIFGNVEGYIAGHYVPLNEESATETE